MGSNITQLKQLQPLSAFVPHRRKRRIDRADDAERLVVDGDLAGQLHGERALDHA